MRLIGILSWLSVGLAVNQNHEGPADFNKENFNLGEFFVDEAQAIVPTFSPNNKLDYAPNFKEIYPSISLTPEDFHIIRMNLVKPKVSQALLFNKTIAFNPVDLSLSKEQAEKELGTVVDMAKQALSKQIESGINKANDHNKFNETLEQLAKDKTFDSRFIDTARGILDDEPRYAPYLRTMIVFLKDTFDTKVYHHFTQVFTNANQHYTKVSKQLQNVIDTLQLDYQILPQSYYKKIQLLYLLSKSTDELSD